MVKMGGRPQTTVRPLTAESKNDEPVNARFFNRRKVKLRKRFERMSSLGINCIGFVRIFVKGKN
ncbi:MAG: hypothetical protein GXO77_07175 [Calditrichaeota bacterium]|nr:hypothetical protein [Calditrichota bacterium]